MIQYARSSYYHDNVYLSHDVASRNDLTPCNKIDKPLVVYRFTGNIMTSIKVHILTKLQCFYVRTEISKKSQRHMIIESNIRAHVLLNLLNLF